MSLLLGTKEPSESTLVSQLDVVDFIFRLTLIQEEDSSLLY